MGKIIYTQDDYEIILRNIEKAIDEIENNLKVHQQLIDVLSNQDAKVYEAHILKLEVVDKELAVYLSEIELFREYLEAFIEEAEAELEPNSVICAVEIDVPVVKKNIMELIENINNTLSLKNVKPTAHFSNWERKTENELNNSFIDAVVHYQNEQEQKMYEEQFRNNQRIMNNVMEDLIEDLSFTDEFEELEDYIERISGYQDIFEIHKSNFNSLELQNKIENIKETIKNSIFMTSNLLKPNQKLTLIGLSEIFKNQESINVNMELSPETKEYLKALRDNLINNDSYYKIVGSLIDGTDKTYEELVEKIVLSDESIALEKILKGVGPFGIIDIVYILIHLRNFQGEQFVGDIGSVIGNYAGAAGGGLVGTAVAGPGGTVPGAYAAGAYGSVKGEELFEKFYRNSKAAFQSTINDIYNNLKLDFEESAQEYFNDLEKYSKLKDEYMKNYDMSKLNEFNEKILNILEGDGFCEQIN